MLSAVLCSCSVLELITGGTEVVLTLNESNIEMTVGDSKNLEVLAEPADAELGKLMWSSSDNNIATVESGVVKAVSSGSAVITAYTEEELSATCNVTVKDKEVTDISLNKSATSMKVGSTIQLEASVTPADAPKGTLKWSSSDNSIATVNSEGYITGIKAGVVNIVCASPGGVEASCTVTVKSGTDKVDNANSSDNSGNADTIINNYYGQAPGVSNSSSGFVFPDSSSRKLTDSEIRSTLRSKSGYSPTGDYAQDAINEIYARNGYVFKDSTIRAYYESQSWYYADSNFSYSDLNSVEKYNISLLENYA